MRYIDGFVIPIPKKNVKAYLKMAKLGGKLWKKYGALEYIEAVGDDLPSNMGGMAFASFPKIAKVKKGETVVFSFIVYKSRKHRDQVNAKVMKDPAMSEDNFKDKPMPFDMKRMSYGGFQAIVDM
ncbi:RNA signal recognition particle [Candidatus Peribacteria bacterium RIFCSPHIGHO2_01_FULL_51_35]|nr:MAG: RNA signal recognition particle [Candidatus Peribacteria bacterium RIFCSPHIGHO2_01_FULL_51_35]